MESLTKHQLILVALLVSFVTSLATGIVTVALMDQAPAGVSRTITQVIQRTVADAAGASSTASVAISVNDQVADATSVVAGSLVRLRSGDAGPVSGLGLIVSPSGVIMADKSLVEGLSSPQAIYPDGKASPISLVRFQADGDAAFLAPTKPLTRPAKAVTFGDSARLGGTILSLSGTSTYTLSQGIVTQIDASGATSSPVIRTTIILGSNTVPGAPLFDAAGSVVGIGTRSLATSTYASFYSLKGIKAGIPQ
ncbi:MAG: hypothetical protein JWO00_615 [Candidatus Parcubacteria bacterium]|nr:hypothetical protein [Candidatus Parcubacteria bacterium]